MNAPYILMVWLKDAWSSNEYVPAILAGIDPPMINDSGYVTMDGLDEAAYYVLRFDKAWKDTSGAVAWLLKTATPTIPKRTRAKPRVAKA